MTATVSRAAMAATKANFHIGVSMGGGCGGGGGSTGTWEFLSNPHNRVQVQAAGWGLTTRATRSWAHF